MPLYDYKCEVCNNSEEKFLPLARYKEPQTCSACQGSLSLVIHAPMVLNDYEAYDCPITGKRIEGRVAHRKNLQEHGCRVFEPGEKEAAIKYSQNEERKLEKAVEETTERFIETLPSKKQEKLFNEVAKGADVQLERV